MLHHLPCLLLPVAEVVAFPSFSGRHWGEVFFCERKQSSGLQLPGKSCHAATFTSLFLEPKAKPLKLLKHELMNSWELPRQRLHYAVSHFDHAQRCLCLRLDSDSGERGGLL